MAKSRRPPTAAPFDSIYRHGFVRVAVATPRVEVASPAFNVASTIELTRQAAIDSINAAAYVAENLCDHRLRRVDLGLTADVDERRRGRRRVPPRA